MKLTRDAWGFTQIFIAGIFDLIGGGGMVIDWTAVGTICGSLGGFAVIGKWLMKGVEKSNETLPVIVQSLTTMNEGIKTTNRAIEELFESRNNHDRRLERVETVHDIRGCNEPFTNIRTGTDRRKPHE